MQCSLGFVKFIANVCEQTTNFFSLTKVLFGLLIFFPWSHAWNWGCGLYTSLYGKYYYYHYYYYYWNQWHRITDSKHNVYQQVRLTWYPRSFPLLLWGWTPLPPSVLPVNIFINFIAVAYSMVNKGNVAHKPLRLKHQQTLICIARTYW